VLTGLAGIYLLLQTPEHAIEEYRKVLQLYTRFTEEEKVAKLTVDRLQVIHTMHNLAEILEMCPVEDRTLRDDTLRKDCADLEQKYIERFISQVGFCNFRLRKTNSRCVHNNGCYGRGRCHDNDC
jgi:hypothetical protein